MFSIVDPETGNLAFQIQSFEGTNPFERLQNNNYYSVILFENGSGNIKSKFRTTSFSGKGLCCFSPYQSYQIFTKESFNGNAIHFHPDFFCIYRNQNEVASNGALFNNAYDSSFFVITEEEYAEFAKHIIQMKIELPKNEIGQQELLVLHLKIILINAIRIKTRVQEYTNSMLLKNRISFVENLIDAIEVNYRVKHSSKDYSDLLNIPAKTLARLTKKHFDTTITDLISERIIIDAKRDLYLTSKPIKEIAYTLGFSDEFYFSRFFKRRAEVSPLVYRNKLGEGREALLK